MPRALMCLCLVAVLTAVAGADKLVLIDGRTFTGTVTVEGETVLVSVPYGTLRFPKSQVEQILIQDNPEQEYRTRLGETSIDDPHALFELAQWAERHGLGQQADTLYAAILKLDPDHAPTRRVLGQVPIDKAWLAFDKAVQTAQGKLEAGQYAALLDDILPALKAAALTKEKMQAVMDLTAFAQLRAGQFGSAAKLFADQARRTEGPAALRYAAIADILAANPDGLYILREPYPQTLPLLGGAMAAVKPGPASLADPRVLTAALHELAKEHVDAGRKLMEEAQKLQPTDPDGAAARYAQAVAAFDRADALIDNLSASYRVEISRRKIAAIRRDADSDARQFDEAMRKLGMQDLTPQAYRNMILRLTHHLDTTRDDLRKILTLAKPYPRELVLEIKWAELDLTRIEGMRKILLAELDGRK